MKGYLFLCISIISEVIATMFLKLSEGFTIVLPSMIVAIGYGCAFFFLGKTLAHLPLSLAYAIWSGVGTALTAIIGVLLFEDPISIGVILGIILIIGGVALLNAPANKMTKNTI